MTKQIRSERVYLCANKSAPNVLKFFFNGSFVASFYLFLSFKYSWQYNAKYKFCQWLDSNRSPLGLEETALPTEQQPLPHVLKFVLS